MLLEDYLDSGREEAAFARLVARTGGMVYGSALRRTGDAQVAEEVVQNVFTLLARKAASLRRHPSLAAWIFQTTRYEAAKAMRAENRRRKKREALAEELARESDSIPNPGDEAWREALPALYESLDHLPERDRALVLERFFEGRKFSEIAVKSGRSEAACKVGLKRALEKLSRFLTSRGVTLSAAAVASALAAEFARSAPVQTLAVVAPKALAASGGLTAATLITNTVQTMSTLKTATLTGAAVLAVASVPFFMQESEASKLRLELTELQRQRVAMDGRLLAAQEGFTARAALPSAPALPPRTVGDLLTAAEEGVDVEDLMNAMIEVMTSRDIMGMIRVFLPVANLSKEEFDHLMDALEAYAGNTQVKEMALQMLGSFAPTGTPRESIERMLGMGLQPYTYSNLLAQWAKEDPDAAYAWYMEKREAGALVGKGVYNTPEMTLLGELARGMAAKDPARALDFCEKFSDEDSRTHLLNSLADGVGRQMRETGDATQFERLLALSEKDNQRFQIVESAVQSQAAEGNLDAGKDFIEKYLDTPEARRSVIENMVTNQRDMPLAERGAWLMKNIEPEHVPDSVGNFVQRMAYEGWSTIDDWLGTQPAGAVRDSGFLSLSLSLASQSSFEQALAASRRIDDPTKRVEAENALARRWMAGNPTGAAEGLPAELLDRNQMSGPNGN